MASLIGAYPWEGTSLGAIGEWPQSLRTALSMMLNSGFPMCLFWGPAMITFYNDAFRPSLGNNGRHPSALGQPGAVAWADSWREMQPLLDQVRGGEGAWSEDIFVPFFRNGQLEETYWTFSYSSIRDETGAVAGILLTCAETTNKVLNERQMQTLRHLGDCLHPADTVDAVLSTSIAALSANDKDFPFAAMYRLQRNGRIAIPVGSIGLRDDTAALLQEVELSRISDEAVDFKKAVLSQKNILSDRFLTADNLFREGPNKKVKQFIYVPVTHGAYDYPPAVLVAGLNPYRKFDELYLQFVRLVADQISLEFGRAVAHEQERKRMQSLDAIVPTCILRGPDNTVEMANAPFLAIMARPADTTLFKPARQTFPEIMDQGVEKIINGVRTTGRRFHANERLLFIERNGGPQKAYLNITCEPLVEPDGSVSGVMIIANEVTDLVALRKSAEETAYRFEAESEKRSLELVKKNAELEQLTYVSSHDLQEPLRKIQTFADLAARNLDNRKMAAHYLDKIDSAAARMSSLIKAMLVYSKTFESEAQFRRVSLDEIVTDVIGDFEALIAEKAATIRREPLPMLNANAVQIHELFSSLLSNALKFSERPPQIEIRSEEVDDQEKIRQMLAPQYAYVKISVRDNGIGFDQRYEKKLFSLFQQLNSRGEYEGTGIGLSLCKKVAENHDGTIRGTSTPGQGSVFDVYLRSDVM